MAATSQETAAACEEASASTDEQLRAIQSVTDATEMLTELSEELSQVVNQIKVKNWSTTLDIVSILMKLQEHLGFINDPTRSLYWFKNDKYRMIIITYCLIYLSLNK